MVAAGLEAGASRERAFANAEVDPAALPSEKWDEAIEEWEALLEDIRTPTKTQAAFEDALMVAQERYEPVAEPISSDARAWSIFRRHFLAAKSPISFLTEHGLAPNAYGRLEGIWTDRAEDPAVAQQLERAAAEEPLEDCPELTVRRSPLLDGDELEVVIDEPVAVAVVAQEVAQPVELPTYMLDEDRASAPLPEPIRVAAVPAPMLVPLQPAVAPPAVVATVAPAVAPALTAPPPIRSAKGVSSTVGVWSELGPISAIPDTQDTPPEVAKATPFTPASPTRPPSSTEEPPVPLERYAVMYADSVVFRLGEAQLVSKHGMSPAELNRAFDYWKGRAASDGVLRARIDGLVERYRNALASAGRAPGQPTPNPMAATLPAPAPSTPAPSYRAQTMPVPEVLPKSPAPRPRSASSSTLAIDPQMVAEAMRGALPFDEKAGVDAPQPETIETRKVEGLSINDYAKIVADLSVQGSDRFTVLQKHGMDETSYRRIAETWDKLLVEGGYSDRYMRLVAQHRKTASGARR